MAKSQEEILETVVTELIEKGLSEMRDIYKSNRPDLFQEVGELSGEVSRILSLVSEENRTTIQRYLDQKDCLTSKEFEHLYLQGAKEVPQIRIQDNWLEKLGFTTEKKIMIEESYGKLVLKLVTFIEE